MEAPRIVLHHWNGAVVGSSDHWTSLSISSHTLVGICEAMVTVLMA